MASLGGQQHEDNVADKQKTLKKDDSQTSEGTGQGLQAEQSGMGSPIPFLALLSTSPPASNAR